MTQTLFIVCYKPRSVGRMPLGFFLFSLARLSPDRWVILRNLPIRTSRFIVSLNKYLDAVKHGFAVGTRFRMRFEGEDTPEKRYGCSAI